MFEVIYNNPFAVVPATFPHLSETHLSETRLSETHLSEVVDERRTLLANPQNSERQRSGFKLLM